MTTVTVTVAMRWVGPKTKGLGLAIARHGLLWPKGNIMKYSQPFQGVWLAARSPSWTASPRWVRRTHHFLGSLREVGGYPRAALPTIPLQLAISLGIGLIWDKKLAQYSSYSDLGVPRGCWFVLPTRFKTRERMSRQTLWTATGFRSSQRCHTCQNHERGEGILLFLKF